MCTFGPEGGATLKLMQCTKCKFFCNHILCFHIFCILTASIKHMDNGRIPPHASTLLTSGMCYDLLQEKNAGQPCCVINKSASVL